MASHSTKYSSERDSTVAMDQRKRKRMDSNRESARRSRMRKQKHLDDLHSEDTQLRNENNQILTRTNIMTQHFLNIEAENSILRAQMMELSQRLESLNEILSYICCMANGIPDQGWFETGPGSDNGFTNMDLLGLAYPSHPIVAAPAEAMLQY